MLLGDFNAITGPEHRASKCHWSFQLMNSKR